MNHFFHVSMGEPLSLLLVFFSSFLNSRGWIEAPSNSKTRKKLCPFRNSQRNIPYVNV